MKNLNKVVIAIKNKDLKITNYSGDMCGEGK